MNRIVVSDGARHLGRMLVEGGQAVAAAVPPLVLAGVRRLQASRAAQEDKERLAKQAELLDLAHDAIFVRDLEGCIVFWNQGAERMYGWTRNEALGQISHELLATQFPTSRAEVEKTLLQEGYWEGELVHTTRDERPVVVASRWAVQYGRDDRPKGFLEINNDVTERREAEEVLRGLNTQLELRVQERTAQLEAMLEERADLLNRERAARTQAEEALRLREEFLSIASHELKTPLTALQLQIQMLEHLLARDELPPRERLTKTLVGTQRQIRRLSQLTGDLLDVSRIERGKLDLRMESTDLVDVVERVTDTFNESHAGLAQIVKVEAPDMVVGRWDSYRIEQIVTNLLSNAVKFGEGKVTDVRVAVEGDRAVLTVTDRGIGIPAEDLPRIFDRFERAVSAQNYGGLGLGLYITKQLVEAHRGTITVESAVGEGSTFAVTLPLHPTP